MQVFLFSGNKWQVNLMSSDPWSSFYIISKGKSRGQFKALQHIQRKVNIIVLAFHSLSSNNLYGQSNELVESISLMCLCIQWGLRFNQNLFTPSHSSSYLPVQPLFSPFFFSLCIPSWLLLCGHNLVKNTYVAPQALSTATALWKWLPWKCITSGMWKPLFFF